MPNPDNAISASATLSITYFTDPLCCWSYVFEPVWQRLKADLGDNLHYRYCMSGMLPDWNSYHDELNAVTRPLQMGPVWLQARHMSGVYVNDRLWFTDPPASSYPACVAVKAAAQQSAQAGELMLHGLQHAAMAEGRNTAKKEVLLEVAFQTAMAYPEQLSLERFKEDLLSDKVLTAFKQDLATTAERSVSRFPSLLIKSFGSPRAVLLAGYRPYEAVISAIEQLVATKS